MKGNVTISRHSWVCYEIFLKLLSIIESIIIMKDYNFRKSTLSVTVMFSLVIRIQANIFSAEISERKE